MSTNIFSPQRQYLFVQRQLSFFQDRWIIAVAAIFGLLLVFSVGTAILNPTELHGILGFHNAVFFFGGLILTSQIFSELHSSHQSYSLLTLPASTLEKLVGSWLITSPFYIVAFWTISFILFCLSYLIAGEPLALSHFFSREIWGSIGSYLVFQTIFLWGACYFRKNNFLKTALALIGLAIVLGLFTVTLGYLVLNHHGLAFTSEDHVEFTLVHNSFIGPTIEFLFWAVLGPYMLLTSYFTLKERQV